MQKKLKYLKDCLSALLCIAGLLLLFYGCSDLRSDRKNHVSTTQGPAMLLPPAYMAAVRDAANPEPEEIYDGLTPIAASNARLVRKTIDGEQYVLMVTWVGNANYYTITDQDGFYDTQDFNIWVTVVPELQQRCSDPDFGLPDLALRLKQLLGIPPHASKKDFVEMWVRPQDLFRPCPDAEINDSSCSLRMPRHISNSHRSWLNRYRAKSYCGGENCKDAIPYPWTQLGYTYDWGNPHTEFGLSEFVIKTNSKVIINDIVPNSAYCHRD